ncbi:hypothetical protein ACGFJ7_29220 [Actinoplanes sp. NPDC048988]|uniref:hypothetical protein n=1 Tax=Actinoplanes sp. NPDC048988 TaxID=3363901 RepID=UPI003722A67B
MSRDRRAVCALGAEKAPGVPAMRQALGKLRTADGMYLFLTETRRQQLHRNSEGAAFLSFLDVALSRPPDPEALADQRPDWAQWWLECEPDQRAIMRLSSEAADEMGRGPRGGLPRRRVPQMR